MTTDTVHTNQPAQGSTIDYCDRWGGTEPHSMAATIHAGEPRLTTWRCTSCGYLDLTEVREQITALLDEAARLRTAVQLLERQAKRDAHQVNRAKRQRLTAVQERDEILAELDQVRAQTPTGAP